LGAHTNDVDVNQDAIDSALQELGPISTLVDTSYDHTFDSFFDFDAYDAENGILVGNARMPESRESIDSDEDFTVDDILRE